MFGTRVTSRIHTVRKTQACSKTCNLLQRFGPSDFGSNPHPLRGLAHREGRGTAKLILVHTGLVQAHRTVLEAMVTPITSSARQQKKAAKWHMCERPVSSVSQRGFQHVSACNAPLLPKEFYEWMTNIESRWQTFLNLGNWVVFFEGILFGLGSKSQKSRPCCASLGSCA